MQLGGVDFTSGDRRCFFFLCSRRVSALSLFPFPPRRSFTPPQFSLFGGEVCFYRESVTFGSELRGKSNRFSTMGDIEAPDATRPRQTVFLSVLPSKEFATSRKGMLLIAEVVRRGS